MTDRTMTDLYDIRKAFATQGLQLCVSRKTDGENFIVGSPRYWVLSDPFGEGSSIEWAGDDLDALIEYAKESLMEYAKEFLAACDGCGKTHDPWASCT